MNQIMVNVIEEIKFVMVGVGVYIEDICVELELYDFGLYYMIVFGGIFIVGVLVMNIYGVVMFMIGEIL